MHSSPATVHPEKVLEAEIFSEPGVQYLHGHHHVPAVQVKKAQGWRGKQFHLQHLAQILAPLQQLRTSS